MSGSTSTTTNPFPILPGASWGDLEFYNTKRRYSSLRYRTPGEVHFENQSSMTTT